MLEYIHVLLRFDKSVGTTELHYSTKKREHSCKRMFQLFCAIVRFDSEETIIGCNLSA